MIWNIFLYLMLFAALAAAGFAGFLFLRGQLNGGAIPGSFFGPKPEKRLDVVEQWSLDARRRLVLVRRDDVEHLIMTGGPVDVVIETGIAARAVQPVQVVQAVHSVHEAPETAVFNRPPRTLGGLAAARAVGGGSAD